VLLCPLPESLAGLYLRRHDIQLIVATSRGAAVRQRFTLAHELGHHRMHGKSVLDTIDALLGRTNERSEFEANYFAREFLAPIAGVQQWLSDHGNPSPDLELLVRLWCHYGIAAQTARYRLEDVSYISKSQAAALDEQLTARRHHGMPLRLGLTELKDPHHGEETVLPSETQAALVRAYERGAIGVERVAALLATDAQTLRHRLEDSGIQPPSPLDDPLFADLDNDGHPVDM
jgi:hypothetical protein